MTKDKSPQGRKILLVEWLWALEVDSILLNTIHPYLQII